MSPCYRRACCWQAEQALTLHLLWYEPVRSMRGAPHPSLTHAILVSLKANIVSYECLAARAVSRRNNCTTRRQEARKQSCSG